MTNRPEPKPANRRTAWVVLAVALAATFFGFWRERELAHSHQTIRWQDGFSQLNSVLAPLLGQRFETLHDQARSALRRDDFSALGWTNFLDASEWQSRYPGLLEIGYAELAGDQCPVKFLAQRPGSSTQAAGFDLNQDPVIREAIQKSAAAGYGMGTREILLGTNRVVIGLFTILREDRRPGLAAENRANLRGILFFALDQAAYFHALEPQLQKLPFTVRRLASDETIPPRTSIQRPFTMSGGAGEWRLLASMKGPSTTEIASKWIVLIGGLILSALLYSLFATQARLRYAAELANEQILQRDAEIIALNRNLERKVAERTAQLNVALAEEKDLNRLKGNFISMVTHEIRTPLALILGSTEILSRYLERLSPEKRTEHLSTITAAVERMSSLLEDVLLFSKAEAGRMEFNPTELDLPKFCRQLIDELHSATHRRCPIQLHIDVTDPARADENLLRPILTNLIINAVKYSPPNVPVQVSVTREGGLGIFIIQDRGAGIPEADRKHLFTPFHRGRNVATIQGTGLGLVIVKHCIERHGGSIELDSAENLGTTVSVRLPLFSPAHTEFIHRLDHPAAP